MYPYHIDSLIQLSEVCKMSEDLPMAAELIGMLPPLFNDCHHNNCSICTYLIYIYYYCCYDGCYRESCLLFGV